jgi:hypothetical protein
LESTPLKFARLKTLKEGWVMRDDRAAGLVRRKADSIA